MFYTIRFENLSTASNESWTKLMIDTKQTDKSMEVTWCLQYPRKTSTRKFLRMEIIGLVIAGGINQVPSTPRASKIWLTHNLAQPTTYSQLENEEFTADGGNDVGGIGSFDSMWLCLTARVKEAPSEDIKEYELQTKMTISERSQGRRSYGDNGRSNAPINESSSQALVAQDGLGGCDWSNDLNEVQKYSKQCLESFKCLQKNYDTEKEKHNKAKLEIRGYEIALESLESRIIRHEKNELAWGKKYEFQNYELKCREIKINNLNLELEKAIKERDELKDKIAKWEESTKNLEEILKSQMSARDKTSLGYSTQLNELSSNHETDSENSFSVFDGRSSDEEITPENDRFSKNRYKDVPPPITGNFLTPRADISFARLDEYAIRNKIIESQTTELNTKTSETTGQTNDAGESASESVVSNPKINKDSVIIEDWNSDDEEEGTARRFVTARQMLATARPVCTAKAQAVILRYAHCLCCQDYYTTRMNNVRPRGSCLPIKRSYYTKPAFRPKNLKQDVKTFGIQNMTTAGTRTIVNTVSKDIGSIMLKKLVMLTPNDYKSGMAWILKSKLHSLTFCAGNPEISVTGSCMWIVVKITGISFKLLDESQVVLRAPRKDDVYSLDLKNIVPFGGITCLYANATTDESKLWHRRLGHKALRITSYGLTEFEKLTKSIESFVPMETEARVKRHGLQLEQETLKKQKIDIEDASITKGKDEVVKEEETEVPVKKTRMRRKQKARNGINIGKTAQDEFNKEREAYVKDKVKYASSESEIGVDVIPTATKPPTIVNWKIISQSSQKAAYQIIRKDGSDKIYMSFRAILNDFSRDELIELYRLVIKKYGANRPEEMYDIVLWGDLKTMFDPPLRDDAIWSLPLQQKIINWRKYPMSKDACQVMLKIKLLDGTMDEVCYQLLKMIEK
ncbi:hypothetical protein Tco_0418425 [Tanacetum coccineum]